MKCNKNTDGVGRFMKWLKRDDFDMDDYMDRENCRVLDAMPDDSDPAPTKGTEEHGKR